MHTRTGDKTGPDIVRSPHGIGSSIQVGPVVANETDTVGARIILVRKTNEGLAGDQLLLTNPNTLVALIILLGFLQKLLVGAESFLVPLTFRAELQIRQFKAEFYQMVPRIP